MLHGHSLMSMRQFLPIKNTNTHTLPCPMTFKQKITGSPPPFCIIAFDESFIFIILSSALKVLCPGPIVCYDEMNSVSSGTVVVETTKQLCLIVL